MRELLFVYVGVDVSKETLRVDAGSAYTGDIPNTAAGIRKMLAGVGRKLGRGRVPHVCLESTGPYGAALFSECCRKGIPASVLNPAKVRHYAKAMSESAKTDPIDARVIREFAEARRPAPSRAPGAAERLLRQLVTARDALARSAVRLSGLLDSMTEAAARKAVARAVEGLERRIKALDAGIAGALEADARLKGLAGALAGIDGVGVLSAAKIIALAPEIGTLGRRGAASLAGLAPFARDSGKFKGKAFVCGGRASVRRALYMPAVAAIKHNAVLKAFYGRLAAEGKPFKKAVTAVMRKLFAHMDSVARRWLAAHGGADGGAAPQPVPA
jgi:transposase